MDVEKVRNLRLQLDGMWRLTESLLMHSSGPVHYARYARESLLLSKLWLGKLMKGMGVASPYPESRNPESLHIEPMADTITVTEVINNMLMDGFDWKAATMVGKVKFMRAEIEKVEKQLPLLIDIINFNQNNIESANFGRTNEEMMMGIRCSKQYLIEAGMWFGMQLSAIRDREESERKYFKGEQQDGQ